MTTLGAPTLQELDGEEQPEMIDLTQSSNCSSSPEKEMLDQVNFINSCAPNEIDISPEVVEKFLRPGTMFPVHLFEKWEQSLQSNVHIKGLQQEDI